MIDMNEMIKKAQELSETMKQQQEEQSKQIFAVSVGGEMIKMTFNGKQEAKSIEIDPEVVDVNDIETTRAWNVLYQTPVSHLYSLNNQDFGFSKLDKSMPPVILPICSPRELCMFC